MSGHLGDAYRSTVRAESVDGVDVELEDSREDPLHRSARNASPILIALRLALEEIAERRAAERVDRRRERADGTGDQP